MRDRDPEIMTVLDATVQWMCWASYQNPLSRHAYLLKTASESWPGLCLDNGYTSSFMHTCKISVPVLYSFNRARSEKNTPISTVTKISLYHQVFCAALSIPPAYTHMLIDYRRRWVCLCVGYSYSMHACSEKFWQTWPLLSPILHCNYAVSHVCTMLFQGRSHRMTIHIYLSTLLVVVGWVMDCLSQVMPRAQQTWRQSEILLEMQILVFSHLVHNTRRRELGLIS